MWLNQALLFDFTAFHEKLHIRPKSGTQNHAGCFAIYSYKLGFVAIYEKIADRPKLATQKP